MIRDTTAEVIEQSVPRPAAVSAARRSAIGILVVPIDDNRVVILAGNAAVVSSHEKGPSIFGRVVDHKATARPRSLDRIDADRGNLIPPIVSLGTDHINVARFARSAVGRGLKTALAVID